MNSQVDNPPAEHHNGSIARYIPPPEVYNPIENPLALLEMPTPTPKEINSTPAHPRFATLDSRLESFSHPGWPQGCPISTSELAKAGFYYYGSYQGIHDSVKCFHCDQGLCLWEPGDDPFDEHLRVGNHCKYILENHPRLRKDREESEKELAELSIKDPKEIIQDWMDGLMVRGFLAENPSIPEEAIKEILQKRLAESKKPFETMLQLENSVEAWARNRRNDETMKSKDDQEISQNGLLESEGKGSASLSSSLGRSSPSMMSESDEDSGISSQESCYSSQVSSASSTEYGVNFSSHTSSDDERNSRMLCKVCLIQDLEVTFMPCGHFVSCTTCSKELSHCPYCRRRIRGTFRTYLS